MSTRTTWPLRDGPPWPSKAEVVEAIETLGSGLAAQKKLGITGYRLYAILGDSITGRHLPDETRRKISKGAKRTEAERRARGEKR